MYTHLDRAKLLILAALGLPLAGAVGCAVGPGGIDTGGSETGDGDGDATTTTATTSTTGDGDGDPTTTTGDGDGDTTTTTGDGDGDGDGDPEPYACENPEPILQPDSGLPTGFVRCADGFVHRVEAVACTQPQGADAAWCAESPGVCGTGADCVDGPYPSCSDDGFAGCNCTYGCQTDADCGDGYVCACAGVVGDKAECIPAGCDTDAACGDGLCGLSVYEGCCDNSYQVACASPQEACHVTADCPVDLCDAGWPDGGEVQHQCSFDGNAQAWTCGPPGWCGCDCGRPFLVDGEARVAPLRERSDWRTPACPRVPADADLRARLAGYWAEVGQFEHASIASFARFAMQLLGLGAPARLIADTQAALADEIVHAQLAFGLASAYAGAPVGPGPLAVETCLDRGELPAIVEGLIVEACVGETLAALEAQEAAAQAEDPVVAAILAQIAADELRHAELGWRSLAWILAELADPSLRRFALRTLDAAVTAVLADPPSSGRGLALREHGVLDDALRARVRRAGVEQVIRPALAGLRQAYRVGAGVASVAVSA